jgi:hypothetical protein
MQYLLKLCNTTNKRYKKHNRGTFTSYIISALFNEEGPSTVIYRIKRVKHNNKMLGNNTTLC